jgi:hypothetical protein
MVGDNIATCECVDVSPYFMEEDQKKVLQLSIFEVHPKFIIAMKSIVAIGF